MALPLRHVVVNVNDGRDHNLLPRRGFAAVEGRAKSLEVAFARWSRVGDGERTEARRSDRGGARRGVVHAGKEGCERQEANRQEARGKRGKRQRGKRQETVHGLTEWLRASHATQRVDRWVSPDQRGPASKPWRIRLVGTSSMAGWVSTQ